MDFGRPWAAMRAAHDQELENAKTWWKNASEEDKQRLWEFFHQERSKFIPEMAALFARLGFVQIALDCEDPIQE